VADAAPHRQWVDLGLLTTCSFLPMLVAGPWSGNLIDRSNRRRLLIVTQSLFITLSTLLAVVIALGAVKVWMLFLFAFASGVVGTPDSAARQVYALDLVGTDHLTSAISLNEVVLNVSRVVGPALGGALLALEGASACCFVNAASFVPPSSSCSCCAGARDHSPSIARHARTTYSRAFATRWSTPPFARVFSSPRRRACSST